MSSLASRVPLRPGWTRGATTARDYAGDRLWHGMSESVTRAGGNVVSIDTKGKFKRFAANTPRLTDAGIGSASGRRDIPNPNGVGFFGSVIGDDWQLAPGTGLTITLAAHTLVVPSVDVYDNDFDIAGTTAADASHFIFWNGATSWPAITGDKVVKKVSLQILSGSTANVKTFHLVGREQAGATVKLTDVPLASIGLTTELLPYTYERVVTDAATTSFRFGGRIVSAGGGAVSFRLRIRGPSAGRNIHGIPSPVINPTAPDQTLNLNPNPNLAAGATPGTPGTPPTGVGIRSTGTTLVMDTGIADTLTAADGTVVTGRYFHYAATISTSQFMTLNLKSAIQDLGTPGLTGSVLSCSLYIGAIAPGGGAAGNVASIATKVLYCRQYSAADALLGTNTASPALAIDTTLKRFAGAITLTASGAKKAEVGLQFSPSGSTAVSGYLFIGNIWVGRDVTNASATDQIVGQGTQLSGAKGSLLVRWRPGEFVPAYTIFRIESLSNAANYVTLKVKNQSQIRLTVTRAGVDDADIVVADGVLTGRMLAAAALRWKTAANQLSICLNGRAIVTTATTMPFTDEGKLMPGPVEGTIETAATFADVVSDDRLQAMTHIDIIVHPVWDRGQSLRARSHGFMNTGTGDTTNILPGRFCAASVGFPRRLMFRMEPRPLILTPAASCTSGTIAGTVFTPGGTITGTFAVDQRIAGANITNGTKILSSAGGGAWNISVSHTIAVGQVIAAAGGTTQDDIGGGSNRLGNGGHSTTALGTDPVDQTWPTPKALREAKCAQFLSSTNGFGPGEAMVNALVDETPANHIFVHIDDAIGGTGLSMQLRNTTGGNGHSSYTDGITGHNFIKATADLQGWTVGEAIVFQDMSFTDGASYSRSQIVGFYDTFIAQSTEDLQSIYGAGVGIHYFSGINWSILPGNISAVQAQLDLIATRSDKITVLTDDMAMSHRDRSSWQFFDKVHGTVNSYWMVGEAQGKRIAAIVFGGQSFTPWQPVAAWRVSNEVFLDWGRTVAKDDNDMFDRTGSDWGFDATTIAGGTPLAIAAVDLPGGSIVKITLPPGTNEAVTIRGGLQTLVGSAPNYDSGVRALNLKGTQDLGLFGNGMKWTDSPFGFERTVA